MNISELITTNQHDWYEVYLTDGTRLFFRCDTLADLAHIEDKSALYVALAAEVQRTRQWPLHAADITGVAVKRGNG